MNKMRDIQLNNLVFICSIEDLESSIKESKSLYCY